MSGWDIRPALPEDIEALMRLQDRPMPGPIRLAIAREPGPSDRVVVACDGARLMGMGIRTREIHRWAARVRPVGALSGLRSACAVLPRRIVAEMFRQLRASRAADEPEWDLTAILESNRNARRLLEAGLPGLPRYSRLARLVTFTFAARLPLFRPPPAGSGAAGPAESAGTALYAPGAPRPASQAVDMRGNRCRVEILPRRRTWVAGYAGALGLARPVLNPCLRLAGLPRLPAPGRPVPEAFVVEAEMTRPDAASLAPFLAAVRAEAGALGAAWVHWGMTLERARALGLLARARAWRTYSIAYAVHDAGSPPPPVPDFDPEIARL